MARTARGVDLPLNLHLEPAAAGAPGTHVPLPERIAWQIRDLITRGVLSPGQMLPSTRALGARLGVSRGTVVTAFEQLVAEGYLDAERGSGTAVSEDLRLLPKPLPQPLPEPVPKTVSGTGREPRRRGVGPDPRVSRSETHEAGDPIDLRPAASRGIALPTPQWRAAWRAAAAGGGDQPEPLGSWSLRAALAERTRRVRAVAGTPADYIITAGAREGLQLLLTALRARIARPTEAAGRPVGQARSSAGVACRDRPAGRLRIAFESPGYPSLRQVPLLTGDEVVPAPVDAHGVDPALLPEDIDALVVTPSHQYPSGGSLPVERRLALLAAARERGFLVVEDEHTAEWRWSGAPLPALAGLDDPEHPVTVLSGSLSSLIHPGVAVGYLKVPPSLLELMRRVREVTASPVNTVAQAALAAFITSGALERHLQSARSANRRRLDVVHRGLEGAPGLQVQPVPGGLQAVVNIVGGASGEAEWITAARRSGVLVTGLGEYWLGGSSAQLPRAQGIVLGFGVADDQLREGLERLRTTAQHLSRSTPGTHL